jgi:hypothetical protein
MRCARAVLAGAYEGTALEQQDVPLPVARVWQALVSDADERVRAAVARNDAAPVRPPVRVGSQSRRRPVVIVDAIRALDFAPPQASAAASSSAARRSRALRALRRGLAQAIEVD